MLSLSDGYISGIGSSIDLFFSIIFAIRLYKPAKEENFKYDTFRGSFFWTFFSFSIFFSLMSINLFVHDEKTAGLYGYTLGHVFLYIAFAVNIFTPFSVLSVRKIYPRIMSFLILFSGGIITYINWVGYSSGDYRPSYEDGVTVWNPPPEVGIYIPVVAMVVWIIFGAGVFFYHARKSQVQWLKRRSFFIGLGLLIVAIAGPMHDFLTEGWIVLIADFVTSAGFVVMSFGIFAKPPEAS